jgi:hypothetical protein
LQRKKARLANVALMDREKEEKSTGNNRLKLSELRAIFNDSDVEEELLE